jgi:hypothetical protein
MVAKTVLAEFFLISAVNGDWLETLQTNFSLPTLSA